MIIVGLKQPRLEGEAYFELIDEFMAAIKLRWPRALIQHEDFQSKYAVTLLKRYRKEYLMFNDDIQVSVYFIGVWLLNILLTS